MSPKNTILPADILESVLKMPAGPCHGRGDKTRVIIYRYDGDGKGRDLCDKVQTALNTGTLPFHAICKKLDADVQLIELGAGVPTPIDNARAAAFGMMAAEEDTALLIITAFGAEPSAPKSTPDFLESTMPDTAALFGAILSAARAGIPVIAEGLKAYEAALALYALRPDLCKTLSICGVPSSISDARFTIYADDKPDHPGFAGVVLASTLTRHAA